MATSGRSGLTSRHGIVAGLVGFAGLFTVCFGFGNQRQGLVVTGVAVVVAALGVWLFKPMRRGTRQWILGTGFVLEVSEPPPALRYGRCDLLLAVDAPGMSGDEIRVSEARAPVAQWPSTGMDLPLQVAVDDPSVVRVVWKQVPVQAATVADRTGGWYEDAPQPGQTAPRPRPPDETVIDFDLDNPPTAAGASGLPPDLGPAVPAAGRPDGPGAVPRPRPRPRPIRTPPVVAPPAGSHAEPATPPPDGPGAGDALGSAEVAAGTDPVEDADRPAAAHEPAVADGLTANGSTAAARPGTPVDDLVTTYPSAHPGPAGAINGVGITVLVTDLTRSLAFYRDQLGFYEVDNGEGSTVLASGETRLVLRATPDLGSVTRRSVYLNLEVADIDAVYTELKLGGVRFTYPPRPVNRSSRLVQWAATFRDPDGHGIALTQWRAAEAPTAS